MAKNKIQDGKILKLPVASGTVSGMGCVVGSYLHGVALTDRDAAGNAMVDCGPGVYDLPVYPADGNGASDVAVGDALYWDTTLTPDNLSKNSSGVFFGFALEALASNPLALGTIKVFVQHINPVPGSVGTALLGAGAVTLAKLASGITPSHVVKFAGRITAGANPGKTLAATGLAGLLATDIVVANLKVNGATAKSIESYALSGSPLSTLTFTSADNFVENDVIEYVIYRAAA